VSDKQNHRHLSRGTADQILAYIARDGADLNGSYIHFFGGEPLIRPAMVDYLAGALRDWSRERAIDLRLGITTNGTLLTKANCEMLKRHKIGVQLSLDGSKKGNDVHRQLMGGTQCGLPPAGSFDMVQIANYLAYFGGEYPNCRMTVTVHNLPYLAESIRELHGIGFKSFSVILDADCGAWTAERLSQYEAELDQVYYYWVSNREIHVNAIDQTIEKLLAKAERRHICQVGTSVVGITIDGDIYPCHDFAGKYAADAAERVKLILGNVADQGAAGETAVCRPLLTAELKSGHGHDCQTCWARWSCARGCPYMNYAQSQDATTVNATYCAATRINASLALRWMSALEEFQFVYPRQKRANARVGSRETPNGGTKIPGTPAQLGPSVPARKPQNELTNTPG
jgi:uncharacterized protein